MLNEKEKLDALARLGIDLNQVQDLDILMERILTEARRFVSADAGSIYIRDNHSLFRLNHPPFRPAGGLTPKTCTQKILTN